MSEILSINIMKEDGGMGDGGMGGWGDVVLLSLLN